VWVLFSQASPGNGSAIHHLNSSDFALGALVELDSADEFSDTLEDSVEWARVDRYEPFRKNDLNAPALTVASEYRLRARPDLSPPLVV